jgi:hypothetical protein
MGDQSPSLVGIVAPMYNTVEYITEYKGIGDYAIGNSCAARCYEHREQLG